MEEITPAQPLGASSSSPPTAPPPASSGDAGTAKIAAPADDGYEPATGFDRETTEAKRSLEPVVYNKVVSDLTHVVWAYGIIFALFAVYGVTLWRRARGLSADLEELRREVARVRDAS